MADRAYSGKQVFTTTGSNPSSISPDRDFIFNANDPSIAILDANAVVGTPAGLEAVIEWKFSDDLTDSAGYVGYITGNTDIHLYNKITTGGLRLGTNDATRVFITPSGDVGVNTETPKSLMTLADTIGPILTLERVDSVINADELFGAIQWYNDDANTTNNIGGSIEMRSTADAVASAHPRTYMAFKTSNNIVGPTEHLRITDDGLIGVGTISPSAKLDVAGSFETQTGTVKPAIDVADVFVVQKSGTTDNILTVDTFTEQVDVTEMLVKPLMDAEIFRVQNAAGSTTVFYVNTATELVCVSNDINIDGNITAVAGNKEIFTGAGANTITIGGATTTVSVPGTLEPENFDVDGLTTLDEVQIDTSDGEFRITGTEGIDVDLTTANGTIAFDTTAAGGVTIATVNAGIPVTIGHSTSEVTIGDNLIVNGDLTVHGDTTTLNTTVLEVEDKNITLALNNTTDAGADGGGFTLKGATDKTILWLDATDRWTFNQGIEATSLVISGATCLGTNLEAVSSTLTLGKNNTLDSQADGNGIVLKGATNKSLLWDDATDAWVSNQNFTALSGVFNGDLTVDSNVLYVSSILNSVGIGNTSPTCVLDITADIPIIRLKDTNATNQTQVASFIEFEDNTDTRAGWIGFGESVNAHLSMRNETTGGDLRFVTESINRMVVASSGLVGIGNTSPTAKLHVTNETTGNYSLIIEDAVSDTTPFIIDQTGRISAGYSTATSKFDVLTSNDSTGKVIFYGPANTQLSGMPSLTKTPTFTLVGGETNNVNTPASLALLKVATDPQTSRIDFGNTRSTTTQLNASTNTIVQAADILGQINWLGDDGTDLRTVGACIEVVVESAPSVDTIPTYMSFCTSDTGAATERMRIHGSGRVEITSTENCTSTTTGALVVNGGIGIAGDICISGAGVVSGTDDCDGAGGAALATNGGLDVAKSACIVADLMVGTPTSEALIVDSSTRRVNIGTYSAGNPMDTTLTVLTERSTAYDASDRTTWADVKIWNDNSTVGNATGIAFHPDSDQGTTESVGGIAMIQTGSAFQGDMTFITNSSEKMRIMNSGRVGIGETSPDTLLHMTGSDPVLTIQDSSAATAINAKVSLVDSADAEIGYLGLTGADLHVHNSNATGNVLIDTNGTEKVRVEAGGNVGIGGVPLAKLHVHGQIRGESGLIKPLADGGNIFRVQKSGTLDNVLSVDTSTEVVSATELIVTPLSNAADVFAVRTAAGTNILDVNTSTLDVTTSSDMIVGNDLLATNTVSAKGGKVILTNYSGTPISGLVAGSTFGGLIQGELNGHLVVQLRSNDDNESFAVVSNTTMTGTDPADKLAFQVTRQGNAFIAGTGTIVGDLAVNTSNFFVNTSTGNVGIGTTSPNRVLEIANTSPTIRLKDTNAANTTQIGSIVEFVDNTNTRAGYVGYPSNTTTTLSLVNELAGRVTLNTNNQIRLAVDSAGLVGIGVDTPTHVLDIRNDAPIINLRDTNASNTTQVQSFIDFEDNTGTRAGLIGYDNAGNSNLVIRNEITGGRIEFLTQTTSRADISSTGRLSVFSSENCTSTTTGAVVITGGLGVGGDICMGGGLDIAGTADCDGAGGGALSTAGGLDVAKSACILQNTDIGGVLTVDTINETTAQSGVTVEDIIIRDYSPGDDPSGLQALVGGSTGGTEFSRNNFGHIVMNLRGNGDESFNIVAGDTDAPVIPLTLVHKTTIYGTDIYNKTLIQTSSGNGNNAEAFRVENAAMNALFNVDTSNTLVHSYAPTTVVANSTEAFRVRRTTGSSNVFEVDTTNDGTAGRFSHNLVTVTNSAASESTTLLIDPGNSLNYTIADKTAITHSVRANPVSGRGGYLVVGVNSFLNNTSETAGFHFIHPFNRAGSDDYKAFRVSTGTDVGDIAATSLTDRFYVTRVGRGYFETSLGVNEESPDSLLHVTGSDPVITLQDSSSASSIEAKLSYVDSADTEIGYVGYVGYGAANLRLHNASTTGSMAFDTNATERMCITNDGRVGIGTTSPTTKFEIRDASPYQTLYLDDTTVTANELMGGLRWFSNDTILTGTNVGAVIQARAQDDFTGANPCVRMEFQTSDDITGLATQMVIDKDGQVGIGTTTPAHKLSVVGTTNVTGATTILNTLDVSLAGTFLSTLDVTDDFSVGTSDFYVDVSANRIGMGTNTPARALDILNDSPIIRLRDTNATNPEEVASYIEFEDNTMTRAGYMGFGGSGIPDLIIQNEVTSGSLIFTTEATTRMTITSAGYVGIGTTNPTTKFEIRDTTSPLQTIYYDDTTVTADEDMGGIQWVSNDSSLTSTNVSAVIRTMADVNFSGPHPAGRMEFQTSNQAAGLDTRMVIDQNGRVGIGKDTPAYELHVESTSPIMTLQDSDAATSSDVSADILFLNSGNGLAGQVGMDSGNLIINASNVGGNIIFETVNSEKVRIASNGFLGINTVPSTSLHISHISAPTMLLELNDSSVAANQQMGRLRWATNHTGIVDGDEAGSIIVESDSAFAASSNPDTRMIFRTSSAVGGEATHMTIKPDGDIGIGTTSPDHKLHVAGDGEFDSTLDVDGQLRANSGVTCTSTTTGALVVTGGIGVSGDICMGGTIDVSNTTNCTSPTTGALITAGGLGVAMDACIGGKVDVIGDVQVQNGQLILSDYSGTPISGLVPGSTNGALIQGPPSAHLVVQLRANDPNDSFAVVANTTTTDTDPADKLAFRVTRSGNTFVGGTASVTSDLSVGTDKLFVDVSTSQVGIGTTTPTRVLDIVNDTPVIRLKDSKATNQTEVNSIIEFQDNNNIRAGYIGYGSPGNAHFSIYNKTTDGAMIFVTQSTSRMTIAADGGVGIGTTSPTRIMQIANTIPVINLHDTDAATTDAVEAFIEFENNGGSRAGLIGYDSSANADLVMRNEVSTGAIELMTNTTTRVYVASDGDVGIGNSSPGAKLHVTGDAIITTNLDVDGITTLDQTTINTSDGQFQVSGSNAVDIDVAAASRFVTSSGDITIDAESAMLNLDGSTGVNIDSAGKIAIETTDTGNGVSIACDTANVPVFIGHTTSTTTIRGNLVVDGTTTTVNSATLTVDDKNIELGSVTTPTDVTANGGGITLRGTTDKRIIWNSATGCWEFNQCIGATTGISVTDDTDCNGAGAGSISTAGGIDVAKRLCVLGDILAESNITGTAGPRSIFTSAGANTVTIGQSTSTVALPNTTVSSNLAVTGDVTVQGGSMKLTDFSGAPYSTLVGGSTTGSLIQGKSSAHLLVELINNDIDDSFAVVSSSTGAATAGAADFLAFRVQADGDVTVGKNLNIVNGHIEMEGTTWASRGLSGSNNILLGFGAGGSLIFGVDRNVLIGREAGSMINSGDGAVCIGDQAGQNTVGDGNPGVYIGKNAGKFIEGGANHVVIGYEACGSTTMNGATYDVQRNIVVVGAFAGQNLLTDDDNNDGDVVILGALAAQNITNAHNSVIIGSEAARDLTTGENNVIIGDSAAEAARIVHRSILIGDSAGKGSSSNDYESNVFIGDQTGTDCTTGSYNVGIGGQTDVFNPAVNSNTGTLQSLTTGARNVAVGNGAGHSITSTNDNVFMGYRAGTSSVASNNTIIGSNAGVNMTNATDTVIIGYNAGNECLADNNTIIGSGAGANLTNSLDNVMVGKEAGKSFHTGEANVFLGKDAGENVTSATNCTLLGKDAGNFSGVLTDCTFVGHSAGEYVDGAHNIFIGHNAGRGDDMATVAGVDNNIIIGTEAGLVVTSAKRNILIGRNAGKAITNSFSNIIIGDLAGQLYDDNINAVMFIGKDAGKTIVKGQGNTILGSFAANNANATLNNATIIGHNAGSVFGSSDGDGDCVIIGRDAATACTSGKNSCIIGKDACKELLSGEENTFVGGSAGEWIDGGNRNTALGYTAGRGKIGATNSFFNDNTCIGAAVGSNLTDGTHNVFVGGHTSTFNPTNPTPSATGELTEGGSRNVFLGAGAGYSNVTGNDAVLIGFKAGESVVGHADQSAPSSPPGPVEPQGTICIGTEAGAAITTSTANTIMGFEAGKAVNADDNTLIGYRAGTLGTGDSNTYVGKQAGRSHVGGNDNTYVGKNAAEGVTSGSNNVAIGKDAAQVITGSINSCVFMGDSAGNNGTWSGTQGNTVIGANAGATTSGADDYNILLGHETDISGSGVNGCIVIGTDDTGAGATGTTTNGLFFHTKLIDPGTGPSMHYNPTTGQAGPRTSSMRFKQNIRPIEVDTEKIFDMQPKSFEYKVTPEKSTFGLIAEEVAELYPELVPLDAEGRPFGVNYELLTVLLIAELKKLRGRVDALEEAH